MESITSTNTSPIFFSTGSWSSSAYLYAQEAKGPDTHYVSGTSGENRTIYAAQPVDLVTLSSEAVTQTKRSDQTANENSDNSTVEKLQQHQKSTEEQSSTHLTQEEQQQVEELEARDREVRTHEQAHLSAAGQHAAGGIQYTYQNGPDGKKYAVGGEVPIDVSEESTSKATIEKMQVVRKAALAPASPSAADRQVAATATQKEAAARVEMQSQEQTASPAAPADNDVSASENDTSSAMGTGTQEVPPAKEYTSFTATA